VMRLIKAAGLKPHLHLWKAILRVFVEAVPSKGGEALIVECNRLVDRIRESGLQPSADIYHLILRAYALSVARGGPSVSHLERARAVVQRMAREGVPVELETYQHLLAIIGSGRLRSGWQRRDKALNNGLKVFEDIKAAQLAPRPSTIQALLRCARTTQAVDLVLKMAEVEQVALTSAMLETAILSLKSNAGAREVEAVKGLVRKVTLCNGSVSRARIASCVCAGY
jgi:hypothetical protein